MIPKQIGGVNIVPFIDIMLVLLVIVLTSATFVAQGQIPISLPKSESGTSLSKISEQEFSISEKGEYFFGKELIAKAELARIVSTLDKDTPVLIRGDAQSQFESFVILLGIFQDAGLDNLTIVTKQSK
ncbi:MAG: biopolymer transporter ExbD [Wolinella sp.]